MFESFYGQTLDGLAVVLAVDFAVVAVAAVVGIELGPRRRSLGVDHFEGQHS